MSAIPSIVSWFGGKVKLARQIISVMPDHSHYCEVFLGGGSVFFAKPKVARNVINDLNGNLVNLYVQVRDHFDELSEKVYWTLYSRTEYKKFYRLHQNNYEGIDDISRAMIYLFLVQANFNSRIGLGFSASIESNSASFNLALIERLKLAREKLDAVVIENRTFAEIIPKYDVKDSLLYLDPPYYITLTEKSYYEKSMSHLEHLNLQYHLSKCKAPWLLSYDDLPEVVELYKDFFIQRLAVKYSFGQKKRVRKCEELLIANFKMKRPQLDIFDENVSFDDVTDEEKVSAEHTIKLKHEVEFEQQLKQVKPDVSPRRIDTEQSELFPQ
jgi:DNA adenine methylase